MNLTDGPITTGHPSENDLDLMYTICEVIVGIVAVFGNALVIYAFYRTKSLRKYQNYYIVALAVADLLVGLFGVPCALLTSIGLPRNLSSCLLTISTLMVLCTISIFCLLAVSIDRYWATTNPFAYYRNMTTSKALGIIFVCWTAGAIFGFFPLLGWYNHEGWMKQPSQYCFFTDVVDYSYLVCAYFGTIIFPAGLMAGFYCYIYHVARVSIRMKSHLTKEQRASRERLRSISSASCGGSKCNDILRTLLEEKRKEGKAAKKLSIVVAFFLICWFPLYTINCIQAFCPSCTVPVGLINFTIILSHSNSALNPFLYSFHLKDFRQAMISSLSPLTVKKPFSPAPKFITTTTTQIRISPSIPHQHTPTPSPRPS